MNREEKLKLYKQTDEYRQYNREYQKKYRLLKKKNIKNNDTYERRLNKPLSDNTKNQYKNIILRVTNKNSVKIHRDLDEMLDYVFSGKELQNQHYRYFKIKMQYTTHINNRFIKSMEEQYHNKTTLKVYLIPFTVLFAYLSNDKYFKKKYDYFNKIIVDLNNNYERQRDDNAVSDENKDKIITDYSEETIMKNMDKLDTPLEKVIYGIYMLIPPRRLEYVNMFITTNSAKIDENKNYLVLTKRFPTHFLFNSYKTSQTYGTQNITIPAELGKIIYDYISTNKLKSGDLFIKMNHTQFIKLIKKVFKKVYHIDGITNRWLRISYATHISNLNISNNEKKNIVEQMAHSILQSSKYRKII
jgi:hypothetical protein